MNKQAAPAIVVTCEHGGNRVPREYAHLFREAREALDSHRGYDPGALELARRLAKRFSAPLFASETTRLLVDLNRSFGHFAHFSEFTRVLDERASDAVIAKHYAPYRSEVESTIAELVRRRRAVWHLSIHSFTPVLNGVVRNCDIGLLYDPRRPSERSACEKWTAALKSHLPSMTIRRNYPYRGSSDGFTTWLRKRFAAEVYRGIEVEVNQKLVEDRATWRRLQEAIFASLKTALEA